MGVARLSLHARRRGETLEEERLSYLRSLQRHAAVEYGEVRRVLVLKRGVGAPLRGSQTMSLDHVTAAGLTEISAQSTISNTNRI